MKAQFEKKKVIWIYLLFNPPAILLLLQWYTSIYLESFNNRSEQKLRKYYNHFISLDTVL